jgi:hypothetical protein
MKVTLRQFLPNIDFRPKTKIHLGKVKGSFPLLPSQVYLNQKSVAKHKHILGLSGMGKSKMLESLFLQLFYQQGGVSFIDPHGSSANAILRTLIAKRYFETADWDKKLLYIEFTEDGPYLPFNILNQPTFRPHTIGEHVQQAFHRVWPQLADGAASRFDNLILASANVLIDNQLPLPAVHLLLTRDDFRNYLLSRTRDHFIVSFFKDRMDEWSKREAPQMKESTLARIFLIAYQPVLRFSLGQIDNALNFREIIDSGTSVIFSLARIQDENTRKLLGCLITLGYEKAAMSRGDHPDPESIKWAQHQLLLDEFQDFSANSENAMKTLLSRTRKFSVYLTLAHQTWDQASSRIQGSLQNVGVRIGLRLGEKDSSYFSNVFGYLNPVKVKEEQVPIPPLLSEPEHKPMKAFLEAPAQWDAWTQSLMNLPEREAMVKISGKKSVHINIANVPSYDVSTEALQEVKARYRDLLMRDVEQMPYVRNQFADNYPYIPNTKAVTPVAFSQAYQLKGANS